jgi:hypothetical protein
VAPPAADWNIAAKRPSAPAEAGRAQAPVIAAEQSETTRPLPPGRAVRRSGSRAVPALMLVAAYGFVYWSSQTIFQAGAALPPGYQYIVALTGVPFLLAAHGFALMRWSQLRSHDQVRGTIRDVMTDVALSAWEIFFCWLGISSSLTFLYYATPITDLKQWYTPFFLVLVVFFAATYQKALVFVFALMPFVVTLTGLSLWVYGAPQLWALGSNLDMAVAAGLLVADLAVLWWAVKLTRNHGGFRVCDFQMPFEAGFIGGYLAGTIRTRQKSMPQAGFQLHLSCVQQFREGAKKRQGMVLWHAQKTVRGDLPGARHTDASIPVAFSIPTDVPPTSTLAADNRIIWTLRATAAMPETDFSCVFEVPIQQTDDPQLLQAPVHLTQTQGTQSPEPVALSWHNSQGETVFGFRTNWNRATELVTVTYFLFWFQLMWLATSHEIGWETWAMFGAGVLFLGSAMLPWTLRTEVTVRDGLIRVLNRRLVSKKKTFIPLSDVKDIVVKPSRLRTGLTEGLDFYDLELHQVNGKAVKAGRHLRDRWQAKTVAYTMKEFLAGAE